MSTRTFSWIVGAGVLALVACGSGERDRLTADASAKDLQARIERVEDGLLPLNPIAGKPAWSLVERMEYHRVPGVSVAVIDGFRVVWAKGYGIADRESGREVTETTLFQAASNSKPVTAMAALRLVQEGELDLDDDINRYLRSWRVPGTSLTRGGVDVTLRHLLSHTAGVTVRGFDGYMAGAPFPTLVELLDGKGPTNSDPIRIDATPGEAFRYSGGGFTIVQQAIEDVTARPFAEAMDELVLGPAGMRHSTFQQPLPDDLRAEAASGYRPDGNVVVGGHRVYPAKAAAGLWTTASDMARFAVDLQDALRGQGHTVLSSGTAEEMLAPVTGDAALGLFLKRAGDDVYFQHTGGNAGFRGRMVAHTRAGYGAAVLANSDLAEDLIAEILRGIAHEYGWEGYLHDPLRPVEVSPERLEALAGRYQLDSDEVLAVSADGAQLRARSSQGEKFALLPASDTKFWRVDHPGAYRFTSSALVIEWGEKKRTGPRIGESTRVPSEWVEEGLEDEAVEAYEALRRKRPDDPAVAERRLNRLGYESTWRGDLARAIVLFRVNTRLYPDSANTYDSLGEALWAAGDREAAIRSYRRVLETLPRDKTTSPRLKERLRELAEAHLAQALESW